MRIDAGGGAAEAGPTMPGALLGCRRKAGVRHAERRRYARAQQIGIGLAAAVSIARPSRSNPMLEYEAIVPVAQGSR